MLFCNRKIIFDHFCYRYCSACMFQNTSFVFINTKNCSKIWLCLRNRGTETSGEREETALLGARNRYALRLAGHQSPRHILRDGTARLLRGQPDAASKPSPCCAGWDRRGWEVYNLQFIINSLLFRVNSL